MYSKTIQLSLIVVMAIVVSACQRQTFEESTGEKEPLIQAADGTSYSVRCLKSKGAASLSSCAVDMDAVTSGRGAYGSKFSVADYYYWNLLGFNQNDFCSWLFGNVSCYYLFGYKDQPKYNYNYCPMQYAYSYSYYSAPYYCYWNYNWNYYNQNYQQPATNIIRMKAVPLTATGIQTVVALDSYGRVTKTKCNYPNAGSSCTNQIVAYVNSTDLSQIKSWVMSSKYGTTVQDPADGTIQCLAASTQRRTYAAENDAVFLRMADWSCPSAGTTWYNNSFATQYLVQKLDGWIALGN